MKKLKFLNAYALFIKRDHFFSSSFLWVFLVFTLSAILVWFQIFQKTVLLDIQNDLLFLQEEKKNLTLFLEDLSYRQEKTLFDLSWGIVLKKEELKLLFPSYEDVDFYPVYEEE